MPSSFTTPPSIASSSTSNSNVSKYDGTAAWAKVVSASFGSTITALVVTPLEVVKVRQQAAGRGPTETTAVAAPSFKKNASLPKNVTSCPRGCGTFVLNTGLGEYLTPKKQCRYFDPITGRLRQDQTITQSHGTLRMVRSIFLKEGFGGIYAGLAPTLVMGIPNTIIYFYSYEELATRLRQEYPTEPMVPAIAGGSARFVASLSTAPFELLRTRQAARVGATGAAATYNNVGMVAEFRSMIRSDGVSSLFRGIWPTLMRDVPFSAVYWVCIESMRESWTRHRNDHTAGSTVSSWQQAGEALINGCVSGTIAAALTTPLDVLKTRSQVGVAQLTLSSSVAAEACVCDHGGALAYQPSKNCTSATTSSSSSMLTMIRGIVEEEGIAGLWRGNVARMMKVAPACAIMISTYEVGKRVLMEQSQRY